MSDNYILSISLTHISPTTTLLPYTTLFRSAARGPTGVGHRLLQPQGHCLAHRRDARSRRRERASRRCARDRKSTRLNSSHMSISYAVFCLKKKKSVIQV